MLTRVPTAYLSSSVKLVGKKGYKLYKKKYPLDSTTLMMVTISLTGKSYLGFSFNTKKVTVRQGVTLSQLEVQSFCKEISSFSFVR